MMSRELRLRIISAVLLAIPVLLITWAGGIWFRGLSALLGLLIYYEFSTITGLATREPAERIKRRLARAGLEMGDGAPRHAGFLAQVALAPPPKITRLAQPLLENVGGRGFYRHVYPDMVNLTDCEASPYNSRHVCHVEPGMRKARSETAADTRLRSAGDGG